MTVRLLECVCPVGRSVLQPLGWGVWYVCVHVPHRYAVRKSHAHHTQPYHTPVRCDVCSVVVTPNTEGAGVCFTAVHRCSAAAVASTVWCFTVVNCGQWFGVCVCVCVCVFGNEV